ncbi:RNA polymerase sigma factor [Catellatospora tritici]|uniref:RNA polymerase sigma factor n=1 Tax=Catellatospora tritici TaxID=2851566 RepID=UPI001C2DA6BE|nr:DUF6596 domain-containing protein [Catellatospora tritici]MBV1854471.1 RNA polymerase subunit sigma-24 [Catellatospora tritici]
MDPGDTLSALWRADGPKLRAILARRLNDLDLAEECLAEALARAAQSWPVDGLPDNPGGWLVTTAWRAALDQLRRAETGRRKLALLANEPPADSDDDTLALIFGCCHPGLPEAAQVALTLYAVAGLSTEEIAAAFLVPVPTMGQRLSRAKQKLKAAGVRFAPPDPEDYPQRLPAVLAVVYLIYNEGYLASSHHAPQRRDLARQALSLARELAVLMPTEPEVAGLAALLELHESRAAARFDGWGRLVLLDRQDRGRWDGKLVAAGTARLEQALARRRPGPYQLQAAIAALHAQAESTEATDWLQIGTLYTLLHQRTGNPLALLNRAVTARYLFGPDTALAEVDALAPELGDYRLFHAVRGELLAALGRAEESRQAVLAARELAVNPAERELLDRRLAQCATIGRTSTLAP